MHPVLSATDSATHVILAAVAASVLSGSIAAWFGAWFQSRHDRNERLRARRIDAADELIAALATALLKARDAIDFYEAGQDEQAEALDLEGLIDEAVRKSARVDLLFVIGSPTSKNADKVIAELREAVGGAMLGNIDEARAKQSDASGSMQWLIYASSDAIRTTGRRADKLRGLRKLKKDPELEPMNRGSETTDETEQTDDTSSS